MLATGWSNNASNSVHCHSLRPTVQSKTSQFRWAKHTTACTTSQTQHVRPLGFCHCWSVRLEESSGPCPQSDLHRSCFKVPAKDIFCSHGTSASIAFGDFLPMRYANRHTDIDKQNCLPERIVLNMFHIHVFVQRETRTESTWSRQNRITQDDAEKSRNFAPKKLQSFHYDSNSNIYSKYTFIPKTLSHCTAFQFGLNTQELCFCRWRTRPLAIPTFDFSFIFSPLYCRGQKITVTI